MTTAQVVKLLDSMCMIAVAAPAPNGDPLVGLMDDDSSGHGAYVRLDAPSP